MKVSIEHLGGTQFEISSRQHKIVCDQPPENGGFDEGMTPPELLLASLGSCIGFYAAQYLKKNGLTSEGSVVGVCAEKGKNPPRLTYFQVELDIPVRLSDAHLAGVEQAVRHCLIHNTLLNPPDISLAVKGRVLQNA